MLTENYLKSTSLEAMLYDDIALLALSSVLSHSGFDVARTANVPDVPKLIGREPALPASTSGASLLDSSCAAAIDFSTATEWCLLMRLITARTG
jgi:hypothetical protein